MNDNALYDINVYKLFQTLSYRLLKFAMLTV